MDLSTPSRKKILSYLLTCEALKNDSPKEVIKHMARLEKWEQFDAEEDAKGNLVYAWAYWLVNDKALEELKQGVTPKRFNRGRNLVGFFAYFPQHIGVTQMRRILKRAIRMEKAKTFSVYTPRHKWLTYETDNYHREKMTKKRKMAKQAFKILEGAT